MEIKNKAIMIKLDKEERDNLVNTVTLLYKMREEMPCDDCPFMERCNEVSNSECLLYLLARDLKYINNKCE